MCLICKDEIANSLMSLCAKACEGLQHQVENTVEGEHAKFQNGNCNSAEDIACENEASRHQMDTEAHSN